MTAAVPYLQQSIHQRLAALELVPQELRNRDQWVGFRLAMEGKKLGKKPVVATEADRFAKCNDSSTWRPFADAIAGLSGRQYQAIGYALNRDYVCIDMDGCVDERGQIGAAAVDLVNLLPKTYTEISASGRGLHLFGRGALSRNRRSDAVEAYGHNRFIVVTGQVHDGRGDLANVTPADLKAVLGIGSVIRDIRCNSDLSVHSDFSDISDLSDLSDNQIGKVIARTMPHQQGERNRKLFDLARGLKFDAGLKDAPIRQLKPIVRAWHRKALPVIGTKPFDETMADFVHAWEKARSPLFAGPLEAAKAEAIAHMPDVAGEYDSEPVKRLVSLCWHLQQIAGDGAFYLSSHDAGRFMGTTQPYAYKALRLLTSDQLLEVAEVGSERRATRYRFRKGNR